MKKQDTAPVEQRFEDETEAQPTALRVEIDCVNPPSEEQLAQIRRIMLAEYQAEDVEFVIKKVPSVVGGFNIFVGDDNYDWSTLGRIRQLRKSFQGLKKEYDRSRIISLLREDIQGFQLDPGHQQVGFVQTVGDGIAVIEGLHDVAYGEIVLFDCGVKGMVQDIRTDGTTGIVLFGDDNDITEGSRVVRTRRTAGIPISNRILGRMINPLGKVIDGGDEVGAKEYFPIERPAPGIMERQSVSRPLETGILAIDSMFPIGRGQRELIIGDRQTGKTSVAVDAILNQKGKNVICVYVAIGQKASSVAKVVNILKKAGALDYTVIVSSPASDPASLQYIAPYAGCAVAEYFMYRGRDALVIYDDLSKHAVAYRTLSLLLERAPGREAYPGDVFYLHSRLLERAAQLSVERGGGSMTALPIVETQAGDVSAYIPTNVISITDGQIFLETELFHSGVMPAVNPGISVSRVGGSAQIKAMKKVAGNLKLLYSQYRELQSFAQFGSDLDRDTRERLDQGERIVEVLKQDRNAPVDVAHQVCILYAVTNGYLKDVAVKDIRAYERGLYPFLDKNAYDVLQGIRTTGQLSAEHEAALKQALTDYSAVFVPES